MRRPVQTTRYPYLAPQSVGGPVLIFSATATAYLSRRTPGSSSFAPTNHHFVNSPAGRRLSSHGSVFPEVLGTFTVVVQPIGVSQDMKTTTFSCSPRRPSETLGFAPTTFEAALIRSEVLTWGTALEEAERKISKIISRTGY